ncbi:MAG: CusA/CzcA family heavy metal efflux RND transporter [Candidatus Cloacimonadota bacterium]|nr:MAG: CusA/CzcA family heavy metal efflux RND transporter [Candidatus Cloacimonadota bacterium]
MIENLMKKCLENRLIVIVLMFIIMAWGAFSYQKLAIDAFPDVSPNLVQVFTVTDGLAPEEIEKYVTFPVEVSMNGLPGVTKIRSISNFGLSVVNIYFEDDMDLYFARQLVNERLQEAREQIPQGYGEPGMGPISTGMGLILFYYLEDKTGKYSLEELRSIQDWLVKLHLQNVSGVTEVLGIGGYEKQFQVEVNPKDLQKFSLKISDLVDVIKANNLNVGAQYLEKNSEELVVRSIGLLKSIKDLERIVVKNVDHTPIYLKQVAKIKIGGAIRRGLQTKDGVSEVISGMVVKLYGMNSSSVISKVEKRLKEIQKILPKGLLIKPYYEQKTLVEACVNTVKSALIQGIFFVIIILFIMLGSFSSSLIVAMSIPFSILFAFCGMYYFQISANLMSFGGLAIAIGMMVDGTIVIVESIQSKLSDPQNKSVFECVKQSCLEVGKPIVFAILIIIVVFVPLFTLQGVEGKTFRPLAYTVALAMFGSLIYAAMIAPALSSLLLKVKNSENTFSDNLLETLQASYRPILQKFLDNKSYSLILCSILILLGIFIAPRLGSEFTPTLQEGTIVVRLTMSPSIAISQSKKTTLLVERKLKAIPEVEMVVSRIGRGEVGAHSDPINSAEMYLTLKDKSEWRVSTQQELVELIREEIHGLKGVKANFSQPIAMTVDELLEGVRAELAIKLFGDDLDILKKTADQIAEVLEKVEGARDIEVAQIAGANQLKIILKRDVIARYGLNIADVQNNFKIAVGGEEAGVIFDGVKQFPIIVRFAQNKRKSPSDISNITIPLPNGGYIALKELAEIKEISGYRQITRVNGQRLITIQCNVSGRDIGSFVKDAQAKIDSKIKFPSGYLMTWGGQFRLQQEANKRLMVVIPITLLFIFLMIYMNFESLENAVLILMNIPLSLVGGVIALYLANINLSVPATVGFIALFGIALENAMVLIEAMNHLCKQGVEVKKACLQATVSRLRPVLMTAFTTGLGLLPLLFATGTGSEVQRPLATVVLGGLISSTILTLLVIPAFYPWFYNRFDFLKKSS